MSQQINFLNSIPKPPNQLPSVVVLLSGMVTAVVLVVISISIVIHQVITSRELNTAQRERQAAQTAFESIAKTYPLFATDTPFITKVVEFEKTVKDKKEQVEALTHTTYRKPFSAYLYALTQVTPGGLWLTTIDINQNMENISLSGYAIDPMIIGEFIQKLQTSPPFVGNAFELIAVKKNKQGLHHFEIANHKLINPTLEHDETKPE